VAGVKHVTAAIMSDPRTLRNTVNTAGGAGEAPGVDTIQELLHVGLATTDGRGRLNARLAEDVPSIENGMWVVAPDGTMQTTWKIRAGAVWHDGVPVTAEDLIFTTQVAQDHELAIFRDAIFDSIESVEAPDPSTVLVRWKRPYIEADLLFGYGTTTTTVPLPAHLLGAAYAEDKSSFTQLPYWGAEFVGAGPFRLRQLVSGSHALLEANDSYVLGRPRVDEIEVRFIPDSNALMANVLAGSVQLTLGRSVSLAQGLGMRTQWGDGRVETAGAALWMAIYPQFVNPDPVVVTEVRFRRALLQAIDRDQMVETVQAGLGSVADSILIPDYPEYREVDRAVVRYKYDPRAAAQLIQQIGYVRGVDGIFRDAEDHRLSFELRTVKETHNEEAVFPVADYWRAVGVEAETVVVPPQRISDRTYRATFPALEVVGQPSDIHSLVRLRLNQTPLPETNFAGSNRTRYMNPELESMLDRYFSTIAKPQRAEALSQVLHHVTDQLIWIGLYHEVSPALIGRRLVNVGPPILGPTQAYNAQEWDLRP